MKNSRDIFLRVSSLIFLITLFGCSGEEPPRIHIPFKAERVDRGQELVQGLAACGFCHGERTNPRAALSGGEAFVDRYGSVQAANITPSKSGIGHWTPSEVMRAVRSSLDKDENWLSRDVHRGYEWVSDPDLVAIVSYLVSLPPVENKVERREISFRQRNTTGLMESRSEIEGYVPGIEKKYDREYGKYLVDHVARCGSCHNTKPTMFSEGKYLSGGDLVRFEDGERYAPNITASEVYGIGSWTESEIVHYLLTGKAPGNRKSDPAFCPIHYFQNASEQDLQAIARYLKTVPGDR